MLSTWIFRVAVCRVCFTHTKFLWTCSRREISKVILFLGPNALFKFMIRLNLPLPSLVWWSDADFRSLPTCMSLKVMNSEKLCSKCYISQHPSRKTISVCQIVTENMSLWKWPHFKVQLYWFTKFQKIMNWCKKFDDYKVCAFHPPKRPLILVCRFNSGLLTYSVTRRNLRHTPFQRPTSKRRSITNHMDLAAFSVTSWMFVNLEQSSQIKKWHEIWKKSNEKDKF